MKKPPSFPKLLLLSSICYVLAGASYSIELIAQEKFYQFITITDEVNGEKKQTDLKLPLDANLEYELKRIGYDEATLLKELNPNRTVEIQVVEAVQAAFSLNPKTEETETVSSDQLKKTLSPTATAQSQVAQQGPETETKTIGSKPKPNNTIPTSPESTALSAEVSTTKRIGSPPSMSSNIVVPPRAREVRGTPFIRMTSLTMDDALHLYEFMPEVKTDQLMEIRKVLFTPNMQVGKYSLSCKIPYSGDTYIYILSEYGEVVFFDVAVKGNYSHNISEMPLHKIGNFTLLFRNNERRFAQKITIDVED